MSKRIHNMLPWRMVFTTELIARTKPKKPVKPIRQRMRENGLRPVLECSIPAALAPAPIEYIAPRHDCKEAMVDGEYIPFWKRDPRALREAETRLTHKDNPAYAANLAKAKAKLGLKADARQLLLAAVKNQTRKAA